MLIEPKHVRTDQNLKMFIKTWRCVNVFTVQFESLCCNATVGWSVNPKLPKLHSFQSGRGQNIALLALFTVKKALLSFLAAFFIQLPFVCVSIILKHKWYVSGTANGTCDLVHFVYLWCDFHGILNIQFKVTIHRNGFWPEWQAAELQLQASSGWHWCWKRLDLCFIPALRVRPCLHLACTDLFGKPWYIFYHGWYDLFRTGQDW